MTDLGEDSLIEAMKAVGKYVRPQVDALLVTDEGIEYVKMRCREDPEFCQILKDRAESDPHYMAFLKLVDVWGLVNDCPE